MKVESGKMCMKLVSVIVPTYNRAEILCDCIGSIICSTYTNLEIIIVDNKSTDQTVDIVKHRYSNDKRIKILKLKKNRMAAGGRNAGIKVAKGEYMLFVDNDNIVYPDMIELLIREMEKDKNIGLTGPISINKFNDDRIWLASGDYHFFSSRPKTLYANKKIEEITLEKRYETCYSPNVMMASRKAVQAVGGFDRVYYAMYEEADFGYRILQAGFKAYIVTDARTCHLGTVGAGEQERLRHLGIGFPERAYHFAKNRTIFMKKYANWYHMITYYLIFIHVFTFYYSFMALKYGRKDIAAAWLKGTVAGMIASVPKQIKVKI